MYFKQTKCTYIQHFYNASQFVYKISTSILYSRNPKKKFLYAVQVKCVQTFSIHATLTYYFINIDKTVIFDVRQKERNDQILMPSTKQQHFQVLRKFFKWYQGTFDYAENRDLVQFNGNWTASGIWQAGLVTDCFKTNTYVMFGLNLGT